MTLLAIAAGVLVILLLLAGTLAPLGMFLAVMVIDDSDADPEDRSWFTRHRGRLWTASALVSFASIVAAVAMISSGHDDEAAHCGPGTHYVQQDRLVGKTIEHDWICTT